VDSDAQGSLAYHLERNACANTPTCGELADGAADELGAGALTTSASDGSRRRVSCTDVSQGVEMLTADSAQCGLTADASTTCTHGERTRRNSLLRGMSSKFRRPSRERMDEIYPTQASGCRPFRRPSRERLGEQPGGASCSSATSSAPRSLQRRASSPEIARRLGNTELKDAISASVTEGALSLEALMSGGGMATSAAPKVSACGSNVDRAAAPGPRSRPLANPGDAVGTPSYISEWMSADVHAITLCGTSHRTRGLLGLPGDEDVDSGFVGGELNLQDPSGLFTVEPGKVLITATDGERTVAVGGEPKVEASKHLQRTRRTSEMHVTDEDASAHDGTTTVVAQDGMPSAIREAARLDTELGAEPSPPPSPPSNKDTNTNQAPRRKVGRSASLLTPNANSGCAVPGVGRGSGSSQANDAMPTISARKPSFSSGGISVFGSTDGSARSSSGKPSRSNSCQSKPDGECVPHQRRRSSAFMTKRHSGNSERASSAADDSVDKGGMDAATFINTRPWVRQRAEGQKDVDMHGIDEAGTRFWEPNGWAATSLDIFGAALNYINMMLFPVICFIFKQLPSNLLFGMLVFDVWMAVDMTMHLTGKRPFYDPASKALVTERKQIVKHYLRTRFTIDLLSSLPYELVPLAIGVTVSPFWRLRCVVRFYRVFRVLRRLEDSFELQGYVAITRLFLFLFVLVHMTACLWLWLGTMEGGWAYQDPAHTQSAMNCAKDPFGGCWVLYHKSLYWVMATVITVGYGDIIPTSNEEIAFAAVVCFSFHASFSYILGLITNYVFALNRTAALFRDKLAQLNAFMEYRQLSESVRARISELYSGRLWQSTGGLDEQAILSSLPASIRRNVSLLMYAELLLKVPLFHDAEFGFIQSLADRLRPHVYPPLELVVLIGEIGREMFFCARGECEVLGANNTRVFVITDGMFFGEVAVLFSVKCTATVRTVTYCDLVSLSKEALADAMKDYPKASQIIAAKAKARMTQLGIESTLLREVVNENARAEAPSDGESFKSNAPSEPEADSSAVETPRQQRGSPLSKFSFRDVVQR
jgi:CRP-like cAMP-binding protein